MDLTIYCLVQLFNTALTEGSKFVSRQVHIKRLVHLFQVSLFVQAEVNQPVVRTVGNISTAIAQSEFGNSVQRSIQVIIN